ncbi:MAG: phosphodiester glycosidase family protein [Lachnospiraceae bacterium]|nr:phosphodiester glycosidase family protein [Lachnospiraceae bacterium]
MKGEFWKKYGYGCLVALGLTVFTGYALLDSFVIPRPMETIVESEDRQGAVSHEAIRESDEIKPSEELVPEEMTTEEPEYSEPVITENSYQDQHISIKINTYREEDTDIYVAEILLDSAEYLKTALAEDTYGRNVTQTTSEIAKNHNAILAVNGDFYGARDTGYVIRNGELYRSASGKNEDLVIYGDGTMEIISEKEVTAKTLLEQGALQVLSFGPALLKEGEICVGVRDEVGRAMNSNPRTAVGTLGENHYVFVVSDGRTRQSAGLSLYELAKFMQGLGAVTAYNLDGGGSSTMYFLGNVINNPTTTGWKDSSERSVSDILYIGY